MHYVYILKRKNNRYYIGYTKDLRRRIAEHSKRYNCKLIFYEAYCSEAIARDRERKLKHYGSAWRALKSRLEGGM